MKIQLRQAIEAALRDCYAAGELSSGEVPAEIQLEIPKNPEHGDFATNLAMTLAKPERKAPRQIADLLVARLQENPLCDRVEIAGPGFINFRLTPAALQAALMREAQIIRANPNKTVQDVTVIIRADRLAKTGRVQEIIQMCQKAGFDTFALRGRQTDESPYDSPSVTP